jgi:hypothetical protein
MVRPPSFTSTPNGWFPAAGEIAGGLNALWFRARIMGWNGTFLDFFVFDIAKTSYRPRFPIKMGRITAIEVRVLHFR